MKVHAAKEHIGLLHFDSHRFFNREVGAAIIGKFNPKTRMQALHPRFPIELPPGWGVLIGEIAHDLRSALDGLVYQLAKLRVDQPEDTEFPVFLVGRPRGCRRSKKGRGQCKAAGSHFHCRGKDRIQLLRRKHRGVIERLQPYKRGNGQRLNPLWLLQEINNADKHNLIVLAGGFSGGVALHPIEGGRVKLKSGMYLESDASIAEVSDVKSPIDVYAEPFHEITFGDGCRAVEELPAIQTLYRIADSVDSIIKSFTEEFS